jgi:hypothetical protein
MLQGISMKRTTMPLTLVLVAAFFVAGFSGVILRDEFVSFRQIETGGDAALLRFRRDETLSFDVWAVRTQEAVLEMCNEALIAPLASVIERGNYKQISLQCLDYANKISDRTPSWGLAQFSVARASFSAGDIDAAQDALAVSADVAPFEGWVGKKRVLLGLAMPETEVVNDVVAQDIYMLLSETRAQTWMAQLFVSSVDAQDRIISIAETLPPFAQRQFLSQVRTIRREGA